MQSPITGTAASTRSRSSWSRASSRTRSIARASPTPGSTIASARARAWSLVSIGSAPTCSSAFPTERRFPMP